MTRFDLVIFDCDGVLVDSELISSGVYAAMLSELGLTMSADDAIGHFAGQAMAHSLGLVERMLGGAIPPGFVAEYRARSARALTEQLLPVAGVREVIEQLRVPICVASNGEPEKMRATLALTGLLGPFEGRLFSALQVARGKPAPDVFLHAAAEMGVAPGRCAVVEDTSVGVTAGVAAGMTVFGYAARTPAQRLRDAGAAVVFENMAELVALLSAV